MRTLCAQRNIKRRRELFIISNVVLVLTAIFAILVFRNIEPARHTDGSIEFSGSITSIDHSCATDGLCTATVDHRRTVIIGCGFTFDENSDCPKTTVNDNILTIGQKVTVRAAYTESGYSLHCPKCKFLAT